MSQSHIQIVDMYYKRWLPTHQFSETHFSEIEAKAEDIMRLIQNLDDHDDFLVRWMLVLREAPSRFWGFFGGKSALNNQPRFGLRNFTLLEKTDSVIVYGLCGRFWRHDFGLASIKTKENFTEFNQTHLAKLVLMFSITQVDSQSYELRTDTRIHCNTRSSYVKFFPYWIIIRMASGLIRRRILSSIKEKLE
ncbi:MAG: hypothetical protein HRU28_08590 [Rhizobiales bacterium]|nr:hypothetical protein [Hyphomicrobiales bacterium]